jgi:hypothetical protein
MEKQSSLRILSSLVLGAITFFILAVGLFSLVLQDILRPTVIPYVGLYPEMPRLALLFLGDALWAALLYVVLSFQGPRDHWSAASTGAIVMAIVAASNVIHELALTNLHIPSPLLILDVAAMSFIGATTSAVMHKAGLVNLRHR